jgi:hypothetical protein|tara:strand:+ start:3129 stop:3308 length:180 start_codon:yes stop_codon:yes gene_type:complete
MRISSKLYTTEASKSKQRVAEELKVPDPSEEEALAILEEDEDTEGNDGGAGSGGDRECS